MNKIITLIAVAALGWGQAVAQDSKTPISNGYLKNDLDAKGHKILDINLTDYAGTNLDWNETTKKFDATAEGTGAPGGSTGDYQYNLTGGFAPIPGVTYNGTIPMTISMTGVTTPVGGSGNSDTHQAGIYLQNTSVPTTNGDAAYSPAIFFKQHQKYGGVDHTVEHKIEAKDGMLVFQGRTDNGPWTSGMSMIPSGTIYEYNGDIGITLAVISGLDTVQTGGDGGHPTRVGMFNDSTTSRPGIGMTSNAFVGFASPSFDPVFQAWEANNDTILDRPAAGVVRFQNAIELKAVTVSALPTGSLGRMATVSDGAASLNWGDTVTAGGSSKYLVWHNGTAWKVYGK